MQIDAESDNYIIDKLVKLRDKESIDITFWNLADKYSTTNISSLCPWPFTRAYIGADMRVAPCCMVANPDVFDLGSAYDFNNVWNSPAYETFRHSHLKNNLPGICKNCYL